MQGTSIDAPEKLLKAAAVGGLIGGAIDISYAIIASLPKASPTRVLQSVASGFLGPDAFQGGPATAAFGLFLHFAMTFVMALIFVVAARGLALVRNNIITAGLLYGTAIYFVMRWVVVPLSRFPGDLRHINPLELALHIVGVGLVIALAARRFAGIGTPQHFAHLKG
jgi:uncharacterized membrane protein YagU involved in acid resistance